MSSPVTTDPALTNQPQSSKKRGLLAGVAVAIACLLACSAPLLLGAGVLASTGAFLAGAVGVGIVVLVAVAAGGWWYIARSRRHTATGNASSCGCGGSCAARLT